MRYLLYFSQVCFFSSCMYYSLAGSIPPHINSVAIPIVENQTAEFGMSESVTENLLAKFNEENILRVTDENNASSVLAEMYSDQSWSNDLDGVPKINAIINCFTRMRFIDQNNASSVLNATITRVTDAPYTFTKQEAVTEYRFTIHMKIEWYDIINEKILLQKSFSGWGAYGLSGDISSDGIDNDGDGLIDSEDNDEFGDPREFATTVAVNKIAEDVLNEIMTSW